MVHRTPPEHVAIKVYFWIFPPGREPWEYTVEIAPDRAILEVFEEITTSVHGTDDEIPVNHVFELDGEKHRIELNWELAVPVSKDGSLVVFDEDPGASGRRVIVDSALGYDQMIIQPGATCSSLGLPEGVLIMVEDWIPLSPPRPLR